MKAVVFAYSNIGRIGLETLLAGGVEVAAVITHADDPGENIWFASVADFAASRGIPVYSPADVNQPAWVEKIRALGPDAIFSFYYRRLIGKPILDIPRLGAFNLHGSLLPKYRGRCPVNWVVLNGETETGLTLHFMTPKPDDGDIVGQTTIPIADDDTAKSLNEKLTAAVPAFVASLLPGIASGKPPRTPQDPKAATYFGGRRPEDGRIDWTLPAKAVRNLVRAVTKPYPGAFTYAEGDKVTVWAATVGSGADGARPGTVVSTNPLVVACGEGTLTIDLGQKEKGVTVGGGQLAADLSLVAGMRLTPYSEPALSRKTRVFILGVNGFIGNALAERLLDDGHFEVVGFDRYGDQIGRLLSREDFRFIEGDIAIHRETVRYEVSKADVVLPLVAIATPIEYVRNPLRVFELDFEENLAIVRLCAAYKKRVVFPSTSEVYGMSDDPEFDEDESRLIVGPIRNQRWIYSTSKQLLDRVIWAYGERDGLPFTLFRPFNWIGPRLDRLETARFGESRAITQMIYNLVEGLPILLVDGGAQKRCFTALADGIEGLYRIILNKKDACNGAILNIGNPDGELSIRELAETLVAAFERHPLRSRFPAFAGYADVEGVGYYGKGYQDVKIRKPSVAKAAKLLGWKPQIEPRVAIEQTLDYFLRYHLEKKA